MTPENKHDDILRTDDPGLFYRANRRLLICYLLGWGVSPQDIDDVLHSWILKVLRTHMIGRDTALLVWNLKMAARRYHHNRHLRRFVNIDDLNIEKTDILAYTDHIDDRIEVSMYQDWLKRLNTVGSKVALSVSARLLEGRSWGSQGLSRGKQCSWDRYRHIYSRLGTFLCS